MQDTVFRVLTLPPLALGNQDRVNAVVTGFKTAAARVLIYNGSAATCFFGSTSQSMIGPGAPGGDVFEVAPAKEAIFVLAPGQKLFGCANAAGAIVSISMSEMVPLL